MLNVEAREWCLLFSVLFLLVVFLFYYYLEFVAEPPVVVYEKRPIGSYHTRWCRDLDED